MLTAALRRVRRSSAPWWLAAAALAAASALQVHALGRDAEAARDRWGDAVGVAVAVRALAPGDVVADGDITVERWPVAVVPPSALEAPPIGQVVVGAVVEGEVLVAERVAPSLVAPDHRAVSLPVAPGAGAPSLAVGDRVDVLDVLDPAADGVVAEGVTVVEVGEMAVTVAVPQDRVVDVAAAAATGAVALALVGPG